METIYVDNEVREAYLSAKIVDGTFNGSFEEWRQAAEEAAEIYAADPWLPEEGSEGDRESRPG